MVRMSGIHFPAAVHKLGINPCVDVPASVVTRLLRAARRTSGPIPVKGTVERTPIVATVVKYQGEWRLYLNTEMRRASGVDVGDTVAVALRFDPAPRVLSLPPLLRQALGKNQRARTIWNGLAPSHRREYLLYLNSLKTPESLARNVKKIIRRLVER
jgi:hypothetical protein